MTCNKCGNVLKPGQKFCTKCGTPVTQPQETANKALPTQCPKCSNVLKSGQKFCTKCGTPVTIPQQPEQKGMFTNAVRSVANAVTGGALNREIQREQEAAVRQQMRDDRQEIEQVQRSEQEAVQAQIQAEREAQRARDRRSMDALDGAVDVVRGRAIWNIQPGEIARRLKESELEQVEKLKGIIVQEGCSAIIFANGELVSTLSSGAYLFYKSHEEEQAAIKKAIEEAEKELDEKERKELEASRQAQPTFRQLGIVGEIGRGFNWLGRVIFGEKKDENKTKVKKRQIDYARILARATAVPVLSVYIVSNRIINMTFGGRIAENGGIEFEPLKIATRMIDVEIGLSMQLKVMDIHAFAINYLADSSNSTTNYFHGLLKPVVQNKLATMLRNLDYEQEGLPEPIVENLKAKIQQGVNEVLQGIQCINILEITDRSADFERFRAVERELYCSEKELGYLQRTGEFRNRLAQETNKQTIDKAASEEELRYALQQINRDQLLHDDEMEQFALMLSAQKRLREAKSKEEEYEAFLDLKKCRLVKEDEMAALEDALAHNKIERDSVTEIMRIQHQHSVEDAQLKAQWALDDLRQDHDWEREDLERRRNWGIEDEERERAWMQDEKEYQRDRSRSRDEQEYEWQQRLREEQLRRENEALEYQRARQDKFDDLDILDKKASIAQRNMQAMKEQELREMQEQHRSTETLHGMDVQAQMHRDDLEANMTAEQIMAKQAAELSSEGQAALAQSLSSGKENELLQKQQEEQKALYEQMLQMQQQQGSQSQEMMKEMARMMQQGMTEIGQQSQSNQQQRLDDQRQRADEYREDAIRQQGRVDQVSQQAMDYTTRARQADSQSAVQSPGRSPYAQPHRQQSPMPTPGSEQQVTKQGERKCPACNADVAPDENFCPECGHKL